MHTKQARRNIDVKIVHHPTNKDSIRCAKELQGLLPFESDLHAGYTRDSLPRNDYKIVDWRELDTVHTKPHPVLLGNMLACFYAHYTIWEKITENTLIFEDDARPVPNISLEISALEDFDGDLLNLGRPIFVGKETSRRAWLEMKDKTRKGVCRRKVKNSFLYGAHAYLLTPKGASKLIASTNNGTLLRPNDMVCNNKDIDIYDYCPYPFRQERDLRETIMLDGV